MAQPLINKTIHEAQVAELLPGLRRSRTERQRPLPVEQPSRFPWLRTGHSKAPLLFPDPRVLIDNESDTVSKPRTLGRYNHQRFINDYNAISRRSQCGLLRSFFAYKPGGVEEIAFNPQSSWETLINYLNDLLRVNVTSQGLEIATISAEIDTPDCAFSLGHKMFNFGESRMKEAHSVPTFVIALTVCLSWDLNSPWPRRILNYLSLSQSDSQPWKAQFRSQEPAKPIETGVNSLELKFPVVSSQYVNDLSVYVWQPHTKRPDSECLRILVCPTNQENKYRLLVTCKFFSTVQSLRLEKFFKTSENENLSAQGELLLALKRVVSFVCYQTVDFLEVSSAELDFLSFEGRRNPSAGKVQFLEHLKDYYDMVTGLCHTNSVKMSEFIDEMNSRLNIPFTEDENSYVLKLREATANFVYLEAESKKMKLRTEGIQKGIREQLDLAQFRRTLILSILAGLYIPLSFVTSFFGMNIQPIDKQIPYWTNITTFTPVTSNFTRRVTYTNSTTFAQTESNLTQLWSIKSYWAISIPVAFATILLPLVLGAVVRFILRFVRKHRAIWRLFIAAGSLMIVLAWLVLRLSPVQDTFGVLTASMSVPIPFYVLAFWNFIRAPGPRRLVKSLFWFVSLLVMVFGFTTGGMFETRGVREAAHVIVGLSIWACLMYLWARKPDYFYRWGARSRRRHSDI